MTWVTRSLLTRSPVFVLTPVSEEEEEEEGEQQDKGHRDPNQDVQVPFGTSGTSDIMDERMVPFNEHLLCARHLLGSVLHVL